MKNAAPAQGPLEIHRSEVKPAWIDYNGHLNVAYYVLAFDEAFDRFMDLVGIDEAFRETRKQSVFTLELHVTYLREVTEGEPLRFTFQVLDHDAKRVHYLLRMYHADQGTHLASCEGICGYVDMVARRTAEMAPEILERVAALAEAHAGLPRPEEVGHVIGLPQKRREST